MNLKGADGKPRPIDWFGLSRESGDLRIENERLRQVCARMDEAALRQSTLTREGDHRIKNSLQIVAALMAWQARRSGDEAVRVALRGGAERVLAISCLHEALLASSGRDEVNLSATLETMCAALHAMGGEHHWIDIVVEAMPIQVPVRLAQPILLITSESVVNALRHAFPDDRKGEVRVSARVENGLLQVVVADNGCGTPIGEKIRRGCGLELVHILAEQISGVLSVDGDSGMRVTLSVPVEGAS